MKKKIVITILTICMCLMFYIPSFVFASNLNSIYNVDNGGFGDANLQSKVGSILGLIQVIGYVAAVVMAIVIGIKYLLASPDGKAEVKKTLVPYVIGCLILTAGTVVVSAISAFSNSSLIYRG
ncbi:MAG TPA: hypothetical protein PK993_02375 [Clostridia bacterium]|jgi:hypothetical protein|nr:hypothetical protein [Clostridia bacterium]